MSRRSVRLSVGSNGSNDGGCGGGGGVLSPSADNVGVTFQYTAESPLAGPDSPSAATCGFLYTVPSPSPTNPPCYLRLNAADDAGGAISAARWPSAAVGKGRKLDWDRGSNSQDVAAEAEPIRHRKVGGAAAGGDRSDDAPLASVAAQGGEVGGCSPQRQRRAGEAPPSRTRDEEEGTRPPERGLLFAALLDNINLSQMMPSQTTQEEGQDAAGGGGGRGAGGGANLRGNQEERQAETSATAAAPVAAVEVDREAHVCDSGDDGRCGSPVHLWQRLGGNQRRHREFHSTTPERSSAGGGDSCRGHERGESGGGGNRSQVAGPATPMPSASSAAAAEAKSPTATDGSAAGGGSPRGLWSRSAVAIAGNFLALDSEGTVGTPPPCRPRVTPHPDNEGPSLEPMPPPTPPRMTTTAAEEADAETVAVTDRCHQPPREGAGPPILTGDAPTTLSSAGTAAAAAAAVTGRLEDQAAPALSPANDNCCAARVQLNVGVGSPGPGLRDAETRNAAQGDAQHGIGVGQSRHGGRGFGAKKGGGVNGMVEARVQRETAGGCSAAGGSRAESPPSCVSSSINLNLSLTPEPHATDAHGLHDLQAPSGPRPPLTPTRCREETRSARDSSESFLSDLRLVSSPSQPSRSCIDPAEVAANDSSYTSPPARTGGGVASSSGEYGASVGGRVGRRSMDSSNISSGGSSSPWSLRLRYSAEASPSAREDRCSSDRPPVAALPSDPRDGCGEPADSRQSPAFRNAAALTARISPTKPSEAAPVALNNAGGAADGGVSPDDRCVNGEGIGGETPAARPLSPSSAIPGSSRMALIGAPLAGQPMEGLSAPKNSWKEKMVGAPEEKQEDEETQDVCIRTPTTKSGGMFSPARADCSAPPQGMQGAGSGSSPSAGGRIIYDGGISGDGAPPAKPSGEHAASLGVLPAVGEAATDEATAREPSVAGRPRRQNETGKTEKKSPPPQGMGVALSPEVVADLLDGEGRGTDGRLVPAVSERPDSREWDRLIPSHPTMATAKDTTANSRRCFTKRPRAGGAPRHEATAEVEVARSTRTSDTGGVGGVGGSADSSDEKPVFTEGAAQKGRTNWAAAVCGREEFLSYPGEVVDGAPPRAVDVVAASSGQLPRTAVQDTVAVAALGESSAHHAIEERLEPSLASEHLTEARRINGSRLGHKPASASTSENQQRPVARSASSKQVIFSSEEESGDSAAPDAAAFRLAGKSSPVPGFPWDSPRNAQRSTVSSAISTEADRLFVDRPSSSKAADQVTPILKANLTVPPAAGREAGAKKKPTGLPRPAAAAAVAVVGDGAWSLFSSPSPLLTAGARETGDALTRAETATATEGVCGGAESGKQRPGSDVNEEEGMTAVAMRTREPAKPSAGGWFSTRRRGEEEEEEKTPVTPAGGDHSQATVGTAFTPTPSPDILAPRVSGNGRRPTATGTAADACGRRRQAGADTGGAVAGAAHGDEAVIPRLASPTTKTTPSCPGAPADLSIAAAGGDARAAAECAPRSGGGSSEGGGLGDEGSRVRARAAEAAAAASVTEFARRKRARSLSACGEGVGESGGAPSLQPREYGVDDDIEETPPTPAPKKRLKARNLVGRAAAAAAAVTVASASSEPAEDAGHSETAAAGDVDTNDDTLTEGTMPMPAAPPAADERYQRHGEGLASEKARLGPSPAPVPVPTPALAVDAEMDVGDVEGLAPTMAATIGSTTPITAAAVPEAEAGVAAAGNRSKPYSTTITCENRSSGGPSELPESTCSSWPPSRAAGPQRVSRSVSHPAGRGSDRARPPLPSSSSHLSGRAVALLPPVASTRQPPCQPTAMDEEEEEEGEYTCEQQVERGGTGGICSESTLEVIDEPRDAILTARINDTAACSKERTAMQRRGCDGVAGKRAAEEVGGKESAGEADGNNGLSAGGEAKALSDQRENAAKLAALSRWTVSREKKTRLLIARLDRAKRKGEKSRIQTVVAEIVALRNQTFRFDPARGSGGSSCLASGGSCGSGGTATGKDDVVAARKESSEATGTPPPGPTAAAAAASKPQPGLPSASAIDEASGLLVLGATPALPASTAIMETAPSLRRGSTVAGPDLSGTCRRRAEEAAAVATGKEKAAVAAVAEVISAETHSTGASTPDAGQQSIRRSPRRKASVASTEAGPRNSIRRAGAASTVARSLRSSGKVIERVGCALSTIDCVKASPASSCATIVSAPARRSSPLQRQPTADQLNDPVFRAMVKARARVDKAASRSISGSSSSTGSGSGAQTGLSSRSAGVGAEVTAVDRSKKAQHGAGGRQMCWKDEVRQGQPGGSGGGGDRGGWLSSRRDWGVGGDHETSVLSTPSSSFGRLPRSKSAPTALVSAQLPRATPLAGDASRPAAGAPSDPQHGAARANVAVRPPKTGAALSGEPGAAKRTKKRKAGACSGGGSGGGDGAGERERAGVGPRSHVKKKRRGGDPESHTASRPSDKEGCGGKETTVVATTVATAAATSTDPPSPSRRSRSTLGKEALGEKSPKGDRCHTSGTASTRARQTPAAAAVAVVARAAAPRSATLAGPPHRGGARGQNMMRKASVQGLTAERQVAAAAAGSRPKTGPSQCTAASGTFLGFALVLIGLPESVGRELERTIVAADGRILRDIPPLPRSRSWLATIGAVPSPVVAAAAAVASHGTGTCAATTRGKKRGGGGDGAPPPAAGELVVVVSVPGASRRPEYVLAIATGTPLVHHLWVSDSAAKGRALPAAPYLLPGARQASRRRQVAGSSDKSSKRGAATAAAARAAMAKVVTKPGTPLIGMSIAITHPSPDECERWARVLTAAGAQAVRQISSRVLLQEDKGAEEEDGKRTAVAAAAKNTVTGARSRRRAMASSAAHSSRKNPVGFEVADGEIGRVSSLRDAVAGLHCVVCDYPGAWGISSSISNSSVSSCGALTRGELATADGRAIVATGRVKGHVASPAPTKEGHGTTPAVIRETRRGCASPRKSGAPSANGWGGHGDGDGGGVSAIRYLVRAAREEGVPVVSLSWAVECAVRGTRVRQQARPEYLSPFLDEAIGAEGQGVGALASPISSSGSAAGGSAGGGKPPPPSAAAAAASNRARRCHVFVSRTGDRYEADDHARFTLDGSSPGGGGSACGGRGARRCRGREEGDSSDAAVGRIVCLERARSGRVFVTLEPLQGKNTQSASTFAASTSAAATVESGRGLLHLGASGVFANPSTESSVSRGRARRARELKKVAAMGGSAAGGGGGIQKVDATCLRGRAFVFKAQEFDARGGYCGRDPDVYSQRPSSLRSTLL